MVAALESIASAGARARISPPPPFVTVKETLKVSPGKAPGGADSVADTAAGFCTSSPFDQTCGAATVTPELASVPEAPKAAFSVPGPGPVSDGVARPVAGSPGGMSRAAGGGPSDAAAAPHPATA